MLRDSGYELRVVHYGLDVSSFVSIALVVVLVLVI